MAKILGKDEVAYARERDGFLRDLQHFHDTRGTPFRRFPKISGHEIDLYLLYSLVTAQGGWIKVNSKNGWHELFDCFPLPTKCVNGSVALKQLYLRYLDRWEKVHFLGEEADRGSDDDEESRHKRWSARALHSVPVTYNYQQHNIAESTREYNNLSTDLYKTSEYDRLALSLLSPLPNEQDFAINVCTLLSNDGKHTLKVEKHPRIIDYLLAHAGVFKHDSLRKLFIHSYSVIRRHPIHTFWKDVINNNEYLNLTDEKKFQETTRRKETNNVKTEEANVPKCTTATAAALGSTSDKMTVSDTDSDCFIYANDECGGVISGVSNFKCQIDKDDKELFCLGRNMGTRDYSGQRVLQIATIMRNLSFIDENLPTLVKNKTFLRFVLLCSCARWGPLQNLGLDMIGNIATEFIMKDIQMDLIGKHLINVIGEALNSDDRNMWITGLEVLNKLSQNESNEDALSRSLEQFIYERACSFLTIQDVMLLIYTLECLYSLSSLGERPCNYIVSFHGVIDILVALVTVEGKSYGPKACIGMKLVETVPGGSTVTSTSLVSSSSTTTTTVATLTNTSTVTTTTNTLQTVTTKTLTATPQRPVQIAPQRLIAVTPTTTISAATVTAASTTTAAQVVASQQLVQQHAHQQAIQENEQFALTWLRATYEPTINSRIDHQELYKHYINSCAKIGRRGVIAPLHFPRCVRSVFGGTVGPNPAKPTNANETQYYDGIKVRVQPLAINVQTTTNPTVVQTTPIKSRRKGQVLTAPATTPTISVVADVTETPPVSPASPILKAQLSAPPKQRDNVNKAEMKSQVMAHPHLSQALLGSGTTTSSTTQAGTSKDIILTTAPGQTNTSLIKSLLATKVNECMTPVSMRTAPDCQNVAQVVARQQQQKLLAQQSNTTTSTPDIKTVIHKVETPKTSRLNGARQLFTDGELCDPSVSSTTQSLNVLKNRKEPPQPPPPPLAPLSNNNKSKILKIENDDSDSTGNNSLASSTGIGNMGLSGISSTEDCDNSLTSFEGILLNGLPSIDNPLNVNDDSNSKDSIRNTTMIVKNKPLMLADLLEKKIDKDPPALNGVLGKELRIGDKGLELVENHIEKALSKENNTNDSSMENNANKRRATDDIVESEAKKPHLSTNNVSVNGSADSPAPDSVSSSNGGEDGGATSTVSTAAAKLFADIAADILEDEEEEMLQETQAASTPETTAIVPQTSGVPQVFVENNQPVLMTQPTTRQIIVSQPQIQAASQVVLSSGTQLKTTGVIVQNSTQQRAPMVLQQNAGGQILLTPGQVQLVASTSQPGQYVLQTSGAQGAYVVAQSQTAVVHGQPQTVLVTQTPQQQGTSAKTIIILQQPATNTATHHQKVMVTPQGQQVVVTQVPRPIIQTSTVTNNLPVTTVIKSTTTTTSVTQTIASNCINVVAEKKLDHHQQEAKHFPKPKIVRDLTTPFVCEWGDCQIDRKFTTANQVYLHACEVHCPESIDETVCQWERCDNMKRKRFSMMTHLYDKHCNTEAMKTNLIRRKQISQGAKVETPTPAPVTPHPGYAPDAALHAIKRHALEFVNPKELQRPPKQGPITPVTPAPRACPPTNEQDDNEGPVTKSIRLTASLILRNLVIYSTNCRRYLRHYEPHLANVALSNVESSRTIAQVLYDMNDGSNLR